MKASVHTATFLGCPTCGNEHAFLLHPRIEKMGYFTKWSCQLCHQVYSGSRVRGQWELTLTSAVKPTYVLLSIPPQDKPVYFVVKAKNSPHSVGTAESEEHNRFYYEENSSLTNHIPVEAIFGWNGRAYDQNADGLAKYVAEIPDDIFVDRGELAAAFAPHCQDMRELAEYLGLDVAD